MLNRMSCVCALAGVLLAGTFPAAAQMPPPQATEVAKSRSARFQAHVDQVVRDFDKDPRLKDLTPQQRKHLIEFVTGNMLFALLHEMGLPVLGREEAIKSSVSWSGPTRRNSAISPIK